MFEHLVGLDKSLDALCFAKPLVANYSEALTVATQEIDILTTENQAMNKLVEEMQSEIRSLRVENEAIRSVMATHKSDQEKCLTVVSEQKLRLVEAETRNKELEAELVKSEEERRAANALAESRAVRILDLERTVTRLQSDVLDMEMRCGSSSTRVGDLANELASVNRRLDVQRRLNETLQSQLLSLGNNPPHLFEQRQTRDIDDVVLRPEESKETSKDSDSWLALPQPHKDVVVAVQPNSERPPLKVGLPTTHKANLKSTEPDYAFVQQLEADLLEKSQRRDEAQLRLQRLENQKLRTIAEKAKQNALAHEISVLNHEISDIRMQLRGMHQLFK